MLIVSYALFLFVVACIQGCWNFSTFQLHAVKIQSDPFAPPSLFRVTMQQDVAKYPEFATRSDPFIPLLSVKFVVT